MSDLERVVEALQYCADALGSCPAKYRPIVVELLARSCEEDDAGEDDGTQQVGDCAEVIERLGGAVTTKQFAEEAGLSYGMSGYRLRQAVKNGEIVRVKRGLYGLA